MTTTPQIDPDNTITLERPDGACLTCPPPSGYRPWRLADRRFTTCSGCYERLAEMLRSIRAGYSRLDVRPGGGAGDGPRTPGFGSKPPLNLTVVCMTDPRGTGDAQEWTGSDGKVHREPEHPTLSVPGALYTLAWFIAGMRSFSGEVPVDVVELTYWLSDQLDWITRRDEVVAFAATLRRLDRQISLVNDGPSERAWIARCPHCRTGLKPPDGEGKIFCGPCEKVWKRDQWRELGSAVRKARLGISA